MNKNSLRIGIDCRLPYYQMGGISQFAIHLLPALAELDQVNRYSVLQMAKDGRFYTPSTPNFQRHNLYTPCHHRWERWSLSAELLPRRLDLLHSIDFIPPQRGARKHLITVHDLNFIYFPEFLTAESKRYYNDQIQWAVDHADHITADSEATRQDVIEHLGVDPAKITTVYLAANPLYSQVYGQAEIEATLAQHNLPRGFILCVGTLEPRKNIPMLLRAYKVMREETAVAVPLILVGSKGWIYDEIFATIEQLGLSDQVRHLSGIFDQQLAHLYHAAGVLVTPSHYEGFGLPALEAMHCGCPVIVADRGSLPEVVGTAGLLLKPDDERGWAEALARVLTDSDLRANMAAQGQAQAATFSWPRTAAQIRSLYEKVAGGEL